MIETYCEGIGCDVRKECGRFLLKSKYAGESLWWNDFTKDRSFVASRGCEFKEPMRESQQP